MNNEYSFVIPFIPRGNASISQSRQPYITKMKEHIPDVLFGNTKRRTDIFYQVDITFIVPKDVHPDMDNMLKSLFDALKGRVVEDDSQIKVLRCRIANDNNSPSCTRVTIKALRAHEEADLHQTA